MGEGGENALLLFAIEPDSRMAHGETRFETPSLLLAGDMEADLALRGEFTGVAGRRCPTNVEIPAEVPRRHASRYQCHVGRRLRPDCVSRLACPERMAHRPCGRLRPLPAVGVPIFPKFGSPTSASCGHRSLAGRRIQAGLLRLMAGLRRDRP